MRFYLLIPAMLTITLVFASTDAHAVVCAKGVVRAGCTGANGAVVVKPAPFCRSVLVNGTYVRRCT